MGQTLSMHDYFGHPIGLQFANKGTNHGTIFGGLFSMVIRAFMCFFIYLLIKDWLTYSDDKIISYPSSLGDEMSQSVTYKDTNAVISAVIYNYQTFEVYKDLDKIKKYIDVDFVLLTYDFTREIPYFNQESIGVKIC